MKIFLIGYMGSGKTKTGRILAGKLGYEFLDTDQLIEDQQKMSISAIFNLYGEEKFRILEKEALSSIQGQTDCVISTGGGLPCHFENMKWMNANGLTIYLRISEGMLVQRLSNDNDQRPLLKGLSKIELSHKVHEQLKQRESYYDQATITFDASNMDIKSLLEDLEKLNVTKKS